MWLRKPCLTLRTLFELNGTEQERKINRERYINGVGMFGVEHIAYMLMTPLEQVRPFPWFIRSINIIWARNTHDVSRVRPRKSPLPLKRKIDARSPSSTLGRAHVQALRWRVVCFKLFCCWIFGRMECGPTVPKLGVSKKNYKLITRNIWALINSIKYKLVIKLITQSWCKSWDEFIKPNFTIISIFLMMNYGSTIIFNYN